MYNEFELNGVYYTMTSTGYCYAIENKKKVRISRAEYDAAEMEYINSESEPTGLGDEEHEGLHMDLTAEEEAKAMEEAEKWLKDHGTTLPGSKPRKAKKSKKSKDVAFEYEGMTLTAKQVDFIRHLPDTCFWENGLDSCIWVDCLCDDIGGQFAGKPMTVGAMISTICEKGLGRRGVEKRDGRKCTTFELTTEGKLVVGALFAKMPPYEA